MVGFQSFVGETLAPVLVGVGGTALLALIFSVVKVGVRKLKGQAAKTDTKLDDMVVDVLEEGAELAEKDSVKRLNLVKPK